MFDRLSPSFREFCKRRGLDPDRAPMTVVTEAVFARLLERIPVVKVAREKKEKPAKVESGKYKPKTPRKARVKKVAGGNPQG